MINQSLRAAIVYKNKSYSYDELLQYIKCYSLKFSEYNPTRILIYGDNCPEWIFAFYGSLQSKAIAIPLDSQSTVSEVSYVIKDCIPDIIFTTERNRKNIVLATEECGFNIPILTSDDVDTKDVGQLKISNFKVEENEKEKGAIIIYTSGTTGMSKGVVLSYKNILFNINAVSNDVPIFNEKRNVMILLPLHHAFPLIGSLMAPLSVGASVYIAEGLSSESIIKTLNEGKISLIIGVPRLYELLSKGIMSKIDEKRTTKLVYKIVEKFQIRALSKLIFSSVHKKFGGKLEYLVSGGAALPIETAKIFKTLGFYILNGYGMTETAPMISFTHPGKWKIGYAGDPLRGIDVKSIDGEICVKGENVMLGYYNQPEETKKVIDENGWLHTGDIGEVTKYGIKLTGRLKEIIVTSNGKNIIPEELERKILKVSAFIKEAGVFLKNGSLQVLLLPEMTQIRQCNNQDINLIIRDVIAKFNNEVSPYKRIRQFHIISEELPKNRLGKIQRFKLSEFATEKEKRKEEVESHSEQYELLKNFVEKETGYSANADDHFEIDLSMDSLSRVSMLVYIESKFGVSITETMLDDLNTLRKISKYIEEHSSATDKSSNSMTWKEILSINSSTIHIPESGFIHSLSKKFCEISISLLYRLRNKGKNNIPNQPCIFVANHQSMLDAPLILSKLKKENYKNTYFFAKSKHFKGNFMQAFAECNNVILMDINNNLREAIQKLSYVLEQGKNIVIFPEGTRSKNGLKEFKDMFAILSKVHNAPIVPIVIKGSGKAAYSYSKFVIPRIWAPVSIEFLKPIKAKFHESPQALKERVKAQFLKKL